MLLLCKQCCKIQINLTMLMQGRLWPECYKYFSKLRRFIYHESSKLLYAYIAKFNYQQVQKSAGLKKKFAGVSRVGRVPFNWDCRRVKIIECDILHRFRRSQRSSEVLRDNQRSAKHDVNRSVRLMVPHKEKHKLMHQSDTYLPRTYSTSFIRISI